MLKLGTEVVRCVALTRTYRLRCPGPVATRAGRDLPGIARQPPNVVSRRPCVADACVRGRRDER